MDKVFWGAFADRWARKKSSLRVLHVLFNLLTWIYFRNNNLYSTKLRISPDRCMCLSAACNCNYVQFIWSWNTTKHHVMITCFTVYISSCTVYMAVQCDPAKPSDLRRLRVPRWRHCVRLDARPCVPLACASVCSDRHSRGTRKSDWGKDRFNSPLLTYHYQSWLPSARKKRFFVIFLMKYL